MLEVESRQRFLKKKDVKAFEFLRRIEGALKAPGHTARALVASVEPGLVSIGRENEFWSARVPRTASICATSSFMVA